LSDRFLFLQIQAEEDESTSQEGKPQVSSAEFEEELNKESAEPAAEGQDNDSVTSKLSKELSNWRRKRTASRPRLSDGPGQSFQSEPARTIKVRGHETLVVRKPKLIAKPTASTSQNPSDQ
jgi:hypothetical protein